MVSKHYSEQEGSHCHNTKTGRPDWLLWGSLLSVLTLYLLSFSDPMFVERNSWLKTLSSVVYELINTIWWGVTIGIVMVAVLA